MDVLDCKICHVPYDEEDHRPRNAQCGHELCTECLKSLIRNGLFVCPKCRQESRIDVPDDLPVCFGLIDVIRAFKTKTIHVADETETLYGAKNYEICKVHNKGIEHRCLKCEMWICGDCLQSHSTLIGCSIISSSIAIKRLKENHNQNINKVLSIFNDGANYASTMIQEHSLKRKELLEMAKKHGEKEDKYRSLLEEGKIYKKNLTESQIHLNSSTSPHDLMDRIDILTTRKQFLHTWTIKNLGDGSLDYYLKVSGQEKKFYAEMMIAGVKKHSTFSKHDKSYFFHSFDRQTIDYGCISIPFEYLKNNIPNVASHVFLEMSLGGIPKGHVIVFLKKYVQSYTGMCDIFTGLRGPSLKGIELTVQESKGSHFGTYGLPFRNILIPINKNNPKGKQGDIMCGFDRGCLQSMFFQTCTEHLDWKNWSIIGHVEQGLSILQTCDENFEGGVTISDCGIVIDHI